jgi:hypothetical protein
VTFLKDVPLVGEIITGFGKINTTNYKDEISPLTKLPVVPLSFEVLLYHSRKNYHNLVHVI